MTHDRRLIEETFPVKEVSEESAREKNIRHGHISTLHIWWARRPLASSRATAYAALVPPPETPEEWQKQRQFIVELSKWENSLNLHILEKARRDIYQAHAERLSRELDRPVTVEEIEAGRVPPPRALDPFSGGGAIPLEALRLGCETYANDYNPVAVLILKATLEYPQKFGGVRGEGRGVREEVTSDNSFLSGSGRVEEGDGPRHGSLHVDPGLPSGGDVRAHQPGAAGRGLDTGQHCRGMGPEEPEGVHPVSEDREGLSSRVGDPSPDREQSGLSVQGGNRANIGEGGRDQPHAQRPDVEPESPQMTFAFADSLTPHPSPLLTAVRQWGNWVLKEARKELGDFYRSPDADETVVGYIWARTLPCQNPACGAEMPLMRQFWLAKKKDREIALRPVVRDGRLDFEIVARGKKATALPAAPYAPWPAGFDPKQGTVSRAVVTCPVCGAVMDAKTTRRLFQEGKAGQRLVAVVTTRRGQRGKFYRLPTQADLQAYASAEQALAEKRERLMLEWGMDPIPNEPLPSRGTLGFRIQGYGMTTWGDLFNSRQQLALITFAEKVRQAYEGMVAKGYEQEFAKAVATYLALVLNRIADKNSMLCRVIPQTEAIGFTYGRQALPMLWDFIEMNPLEHNSGWSSTLSELGSNLEHLSLIPHPPTLTPPTVSHASATRLPYPDNHFDAVFTDPPYYDNVPYSYLSDFFYVWLKRTVGHLYPDLFATPLTPKGEEIVAYSHGKGGLEEGKRRFETMLSEAFREIHRVLKPHGIAVIVYAYKTTEGWETVVNALLDSGLVISGAWPLSTEMQARLRANESAALASSIYIVARKMERQPTGFYNEVREELRRYLDRKLQRLWEEGIGGADFFIAAIGSAIEVFGKYEKIMDYEGNIIRADRLLEEVRTLATDFAVRQILHNGFAGEISALSRFYVLWRWNFGEARVPFDDARKLAQSCGVDLAQEWGRRGTFIKKEREFIRVLGPHQRKIEEMEKDERELINVLHLTVRLWEAGKQDEMIDLLARTGFGTSEAFYRVAQAISETLPIASKEKKLLDGFLTSRERVRRAVAERGTQGRLF